MDSVSSTLERVGAQVVIIASHSGAVEAVNGTLDVTKSALTTDSVEYDGLAVAGGESAEALARDPYIAVNLGEAYRHYKPIAAWGEGAEVLDAAGIPGDAPGVIMSPKAQ